LNYPVWDVHFGSQWLIATIAVIHVCISHFAIGGGLFLVAMELRARRHGDAPLLSWLRSHTRFFLVLTVVFGALTGVGIWFTIGLVSPEATSNLIHVFLWAWAIEWVLFLVEILSILVYAATWDSLPPTTHRMVGWIYFAAAYLSLAVINGILTFQLTPGRWLATRGFWDAFFNPGYWPSLALRTLICIILAGAYAILSASFLKEHTLKAEVARYGASWVWMPATLLAPTLYWYLLTVPQSHLGLFKLNGILQGFAGFVLLSSTLMVVLALAVAWIRPVRTSRLAALALLLLALGSFGATEWVREDLRGPYLIGGYVYANQIPVRQEEAIRRRGLLPSALFVASRDVAQNPTAAGEEVFRISCGPCHRPFHGFNALRNRIRGLAPPFVTHLVQNTGIMRGGMPPFMGTRAEAEALTAYITSRGIPPTDNFTGRAAWNRRCQPCHSVHDSFRPVLDAFKGQAPAEIADTIANIDLMSDKMPKWSGSETEKIQLAGFLAKACATGGKR
jgi:mono/diheme cytochrome c family protein